ncbi:MAG TPA: AraC family transcriptional regulator [Acetobacteraceae bacterium]
MPTSRTEHDGLWLRACWVKGTVEAFKQEGIDVAALFREAGLDLTILDNPDSRIPAEKYNLLWRLAVAQSGNPVVGLAAARIPRPASFDIVGYAMMSAPDLRGVLERVVRYVRIISGVATMTVADAQEGCRLSLALKSGGEEVVWQRYAFSLMTWLSFIRWIMIRNLRPLAVELTMPANDDLLQYQEAFDGPLRFGAAANALLFSQSDAELPLPTAHAELANVHERIAGEYLAQLDRSELSARVRSVMMKGLSDGSPRRAAVARALGMSERTLQRRLEEEGSSFRQLLDDTHKDLARQYIERVDLSFADVAYILGFNDQSSFFRATKRWFGTTPSKYRLLYGKRRARGARA